MWLYNKSVLGMSETRGDSTRVVVIIKRVWLAVRFNCKLSFILRNELSEKIAETDSTFALSRGECVVNEALSVELPQEVLANRARKLKLVVMMISANGMVPAGFVTFATHPRQFNEQFEAILPLERCEDTRAQIKFMHLYENCGRTPLQQSYLYHLGRPGVSPSKQPQLSSHSLGKDNLRKQRSEARSPQQTLFAKPLISPRLLSRSPEQPVQVNVFDRIAEENESSLNPINQEQLVKEHQQYWLEIVRMEEEMEALKEQSSRLKEENAALKRDSQALKEYYEGHEEKTHALLGEVQENGETMRRLEAQLAEYRTIVAQKDELEREFQKVMEIQSSEFRQNLNKLADQEEKLRSAASEKQIIAMKLQTLEETVTFLQREAKKHSDENLLLREKNTEQEDRLYFLAKSNDSQKNIILELEAKIAHLSRQNTELLTLKEGHLVLTKEAEQLREQIAKKDERLAEIQRQHSQSREMLMLQSSLKEEEAHFANTKHALSIQELQELKQAYIELKQTHQTLIGTSATQQSKMKIFEREVQLAGKEKEELMMQLRRKTEEADEVRGQRQQFEEQVKILSLKLIQQEASLAGKTAGIQQLKDSLKQAEQEKDELLRKKLAIQSEFQEMSLLLSREVEEKNKLTILLTTLEENYRSLQDEKSYMTKARDELLKRNADLHAQIDTLTNIAKENQKNHQEELQKLKAELNLSQEQLGEVIEKTSVIQLQLETTLAKLNQKPARNSSRDQYQESYNQSMTALTLKNAKLEKELQEANKQLQKDREAASTVSGQLAAKEAELIEVKAFTHNKLQENLRFMKENSELKSKLAENAESIGKLQALISNKQAQVAQLIRTNEQLAKTIKESLKKIEELSSELQFVTEVLQRERQEKSDIEKEIDHLEKGELPNIDQVGNLKEDSIEESRLDEGRLEIESKFVLPSDERQKKSKQ